MFVAQIWPDTDTDTDVKHVPEYTEHREDVCAEGGQRVC